MTRTQLKAKLRPMFWKLQALRLKEYSFVSKPNFWKLNFSQLHERQLVSRDALECYDSRYIDLNQVGIPFFQQNKSNSIIFDITGFMIFQGKVELNDNFNSRIANFFV